MINSEHPSVNEISQALTSSSGSSNMNAQLSLGIG